MDVDWVKIASWHAVKLWAPDEPRSVIESADGPFSGVAHTYCGRSADATPTTDRGAGKTCESCLRIIAPK